jgi:hypothetical protein
MKIEAGQKYVQRNGNVVGPLKKNGTNSLYPWTDGAKSWTNGGAFYHLGKPDNLDLVAPFVPWAAPSRTTTPVMPAAPEKRKPTAGDRVTKYVIGDRVKFTSACQKLWFFGPHSQYTHGIIAESNRPHFEYKVKIVGNPPAHLEFAMVDAIHIERDEFQEGDVVKVMDRFSDNNGRIGRVVEVYPTSAANIKVAFITATFHQPTGGMFASASLVRMVSESSAITNQLPVAANTYIVCLMVDGSPRPSLRPFVHKTLAAAEAESARLARKFRGKEFSVFAQGSTSGRLDFQEEWKEHAWNGRIPSAVISMCRLTGLGPQTARQAVDDWLSRERAA